MRVREDVMMVADVKEGFQDATLLALRVEEEATSQGKQTASRSWKGKGVDSLIEPPEGMQSCQHLDFKTSDLQYCKIQFHVVLSN